MPQHENRAKKSRKSWAKWKMKSERTTVCCRNWFDVRFYDRVCR